MRVSCPFWLRRAVQSIATWLMPSVHLLGICAGKCGGAGAGKDPARRPTDPDFAPGFEVGFADGFPYLLLAEVRV